MRHVGELFKIVMVVTGGKDGWRGGVDALRCVQCAWLGRGGAGDLKMMKFHAKSGGVKSKTCVAPRRTFLLLHALVRREGRCWRAEYSASCFSTQQQFVLS